MYNEYLLYGALIPSAEYLYDSGLVDKVYKFYNLDFEKYQAKYPIFKDYDQNMIPIYALYLEVCNQCIYDLSIGYEKVISDLKDESRNIKQLIDEMLRNLSDLLRDFNVNSKNLNENYEHYKKEQLGVYNSDPNVIKFMNKTYTDNVKKSVKSYLLSNSVKLESVGLNLSHEEEIDRLVYMIFEQIYKQYCEMCKHNPIYKYKFKKNMISTDQELVTQYVSRFLDNLNAFLFTSEEYEDYIHHRKNYGICILNIVDAQFMLDYGSSRVRKEDEEE